MKPLYLVVVISPFGLRLVSFKLTYTKPTPFHYTRGEGSCLVFKLVDGDYSTNFYNALKDGTIMSDVGEFTIEADLSSIPDKKIKRNKELEDFRKEQEEFYKKSNNG